MIKIKKIPKFKTTAEETRFWQTHDSTNYIDWSSAKHASFSNLKPSTKTISLRLPEHLLNDLKTLANKEDVPYQSLMKMLLSQGVIFLRKNT
jgi:predicted DNA binding CopG/RHH family protein